MPDMLTSLWWAVRRWPLYTLLAMLGLAAFAGAGLRGYRLLGDDNESTETALNGPPQAGGHGGHVRYYHK